LMGGQATGDGGIRDVAVSFGQLCTHFKSNLADLDIGFARVGGDENIIEINFKDDQQMHNFDELINGDFQNYVNEVLAEISRETSTIKINNPQAVQAIFNNRKKLLEVFKNAPDFQEFKDWVELFEQKITEFKKSNLDKLKLRKDGLDGDIRFLDLFENDDEMMKDKYIRFLIDELIGQYPHEVYSARVEDQTLEQLLEEYKSQLLNLGKNETEAQNEIDSIRDGTMDPSKIVGFSIFTDFTSRDSPANLKANDPKDQIRINGSIQRVFWLLGIAKEVFVRLREILQGNRPRREETPNF
jgi:hypothetical protein